MSLFNTFLQTFYLFVFFEVVDQLRVRNQVFLVELKFVCWIFHKKAKVAHVRREIKLFFVVSMTTFMCIGFVSWKILHWPGMDQGISC